VKPNDYQVYQALHDVLYEIRIFLETTRETISRNEVIPVLLESRLLHTRNLLDFFSHSQSQRCKDDVLAEDFAFPLQPLCIKDPYPQMLNKFLAHITYERYQHRSQEWPLADTVLPVLDALEKFLQHLINNYLDGSDTLYRPQLRDSFVVQVREIRKMIMDMKSEPKHKQ
jgi:hypothetical protein